MAKEEKISDELKVIKWGDENEKILKSWADERCCLAHTRPHAHRQRSHLLACRQSHTNMEEPALLLGFRRKEEQYFADSKKSFWLFCEK